MGEEEEEGEQRVPQDFLPLRRARFWKQVQEVWVFYSLALKVEEEEGEELIGHALHLEVAEVGYHSTLQEREASQKKSSQEEGEGVVGQMFQAGWDLKVVWVGEVAEQDAVVVQPNHIGEAAGLLLA